MIVPTSIENMITQANKIAVPIKRTTVISKSIDVANSNIHIKKVMANSVFLLFLNINKILFLLYLQIY